MNTRVIVFSQSCCSSPAHVFQSPVAPSPTVTSFPSGLVNSALLPGFLTVDSPVTPPAWATQMVSLLEQQTRACEVFYDYYFDEHDGQMEMYPR